MCEAVNFGVSRRCVCRVREFCLGAVLLFCFPTEASEAGSAPVTPTGDPPVITSWLARPKGARCGQGTTSESA